MQPLQTYLDVATFIHKLHTLQTKYNKRLSNWFDEDWTEPQYIKQYLEGEIESFYEDLIRESQREIDNYDESHKLYGRAAFSDRVKELQSIIKECNEALIISSDTIDSNGELKLNLQS
jgi:hypothetical protein